MILATLLLLLIFFLSSVMTSIVARNFTLQMHFRRHCWSMHALYATCLVSIDLISSQQTTLLGKTLTFSPATIASQGQSHVTLSGTARRSTRYLLMCSKRDGQPLIFLIKAFYSQDLILHNGLLQSCRIYCLSCYWKVPFLPESLPSQTCIPWVLFETSDNRVPT